MERWAEGCYKDSWVNGRADGAIGGAMGGGVLYG